MKKLLYSTIVCSLLASFIFYGCNKENVTNDPISPATSIITLPQPELANDMLIFNTWEDFATAVQYLNQKGTGFILKWNKDLNFRSQEAIFQDIINAENIIKDAKAATLDPNLPLEELKKIQVPHSEIFKKYLEQGLIIEVPESDGSKSYKHNVFNPTYMCALNEDGFVKVNDTIYQYLPNRVKFISDGDFNKINKLKQINASSNTENLYVVEYQARLKSMQGGNWSQTSDWYENGSFKRVNIAVVAQCPSSEDYQTYAFVNFYLEVIAQGWLFGWDFRNDYNPIDVTQGSWSWLEHYALIENLNNQYYDSHGGSHYYNDFPVDGYTNHCKFYLNPNGWVGEPYYYLLSFSMNYSFTATINVIGNISLSH
jgi:hypothetical protein